MIKLYKVGLEMSILHFSIELLHFEDIWGKKTEILK